MCLAVPGKIISISNDEPCLRMGKVGLGGSMIKVSLAYVPEAQVGDYIIVPAGFALSAINQEEAKQTLDYIEQLSDQTFS